MDETSNVIIGTLSGFIIAFFAEPVKNYFQNRTKLHNLRVALYKELVSNYYILTHFVMDGDASDAYTIHNLGKYELRTEFYNHTLQYESSLFYQLKEANVLNISYVRLRQIINLNTDLPAIFGKRALKSAPAIFTQHADTFKYIFTTSFAHRTFDPSVLKKLVTLKQYKEIMEKGRETIAKEDLDKE